MSSESILNSNVNISTMYDETGRTYFNARVSFSTDDVLTISRNSIQELLEDLPEVIMQAIQARIIHQHVAC